MNAQGKNSRVSRRDDEGVALLVALVFIALLLAIVTQYGYETRVDASMVESAVNGAEALTQARAATAMGLSLLESDLQQEKNGTNNSSSSGSGSSGSATQGAYDSLQDAWADQTESGGAPPFQIVGDGVAMMWNVSDEYGKINLNALIRQARDGEFAEDEPLIEALHKFFAARGDGSVDPTDAILDWIDGPETGDTADETRQDGAESDYYQALPRPYVCKNAHMDSIEELLLIKDITPALYFGDPTKIDSKTGARLELPLSECFTTRGHPKGLVNANTAPRAVLAALAEAAGGDATTADTIINARTQSPFTTVDDIKQRGAMISVTTAARPRGRDLLIVASNIFRIWGDGFSGDAQARVETFVWRNANATQSPNSSGSGSGSSSSSSSSETVSGNEAFRILSWRIIK